MRNPAACTLACTPLHAHCLGSLRCRVGRHVKALNGGELLLPRAPAYPKVVCFGFFSINKWYVVVFFFNFLTVHLEPLRLSRHATQL